SAARRAGANAPAPRGARPRRDAGATVRWRAEAGSSAARRAGANAPAPRGARPKRDAGATVRWRAHAGSSAARQWLLPALLLAPAGGRKADYIDWQRMEEQAKGVPYRDTRFFNDGRVLQVPPDGTIDRNATLGDPALTEGMVGTTYVDRVPFRITAEVMERGRERFNIICAACHGLAGDGESEVAKQMTLRKPPSLVEPQIRAYPPGRIFRVISFGYGFMPSYHTQLTIHDRWAVVAYLRALQLASGTPLAELPAAVRTEATQRLGGTP